MDMQKAAPKKNSVAKAGRVTIDDLAVMMKRGFESIEIDLSEFKRETNTALFSIDSKLESMDARLKAVETVLEPLSTSYHVFSHQLRTLDTRVNVLEQKNGIQPE
jgi:hypothetical protein